MSVGYTVEVDTIYDLAANTAWRAVQEGVESAQISGLLGMLETRAGIEGIKVLIAHVIRQQGRGLLGEYTAKNIVSFTSKALGTTSDDVTKVETLRYFLGLIKWFYDYISKLPHDIVQRGRINTFKELSEFFAQYPVRRR